MDLSNIWTELRRLYAGIAMVNGITSVERSATPVINSSFWQLQLGILDSNLSNELGLSRPRLWQSQIIKPQVSRQVWLVMPWKSHWRSAQDWNTRSSFGIPQPRPQKSSPSIAAGPDNPSTSPRIHSSDHPQLHAMTDNTQT